MDWRPLHHKVILQIADSLTTLLSFVVSYFLWQWLRWVALPYDPSREIIFDESLIIIVLFLSFLWSIVLDVQGAYSYQRFTSFKKEVGMIFRTLCFGLLMLIGMIFLFRPGYIPRTWVGIFGVVNFGLLTLEKFLLFGVAQLIRQRGHNRKIVLVAGTGGEARKFMEKVQQHFHWGLDIVGFLTNDPKQVGKEAFGKRILGTIRDIAEVLHENPVDEVIITVSTRRLGEMQEILGVCELEGVQVRVISDFLGSIAKRFRADVIHELPIISISYIPRNHWALAVKRGMDIVLSAVALILLTPWFLIIAAAIKLSSPGPVFYEWNVVGWNKKPFKSWKFRTMVVGADKMKDQLAHLNEMSGPVFKITNDHRITPIGRFLRKFSLDELPQLFSVLKGDMSLVGPRPVFPKELKGYDSWQRRKLSIKPGLTCLWQVNGRNKIHDFNDWAKMDLEYIDNWSLWLDIKILLKTIPAVMSGKGAS